MSNIVWIENYRSTLTMDGVDYIFPVVTIIWISQSA